MKSHTKRPFHPISPTLAATLALACWAAADQVSGLHVFAPGQVAKAADINENFAKLASAINGNLDGANIQSGTLTSRELASRSVGSSELDEFVVFGSGGESGHSGWLNSAGAEKTRASVNNDGGGYIDIIQERDGQPAVVLTTPVSGDGGHLDLYSSSGTVAVQLQSDGDVYKTGNNGFIHPHPRDPFQQIVYMSLEGGERGTYFRLRARLVAGVAVVEPPEDWRLVTAESGITVQATPHGDCGGLFVAEAARDRIVIRERQGGHSNVEFDLLVNGLREGFTEHRIYEPNTMFLPGAERWEGDLQSGVARTLVENGILASDGTVNRRVVELVRQALRDDPSVCLSAALREEPRTEPR